MAGAVFAAPSRAYVGRALRPFGCARRRRSGMKIHLLPPLPPAPPAVPQRAHPSALEAELASEELIETAQRRRSQMIKRTVSRKDSRDSGSDRNEAEPDRKG